jgi:hypothetical protein
LPISGFGKATLTTDDCGITRRIKHAYYHISNISNSPNELLPLTRILLADRRAAYLSNAGVSFESQSHCVTIIFSVTALQWVHPSSKEMYRILEDDICVLFATPYGVAGYSYFVYIKYFYGYD